jgi:hypothetical protein
MGSYLVSAMNATGRSLIPEPNDFTKLVNCVFRVHGPDRYGALHLSASQHQRPAPICLIDGALSNVLRSCPKDHQTHHFVQLFHISVLGGLTDIRLWVGDLNATGLISELHSARPTQNINAVAQDDIAGTNGPGETPHADDWSTDEPNESFTSSHPIDHPTQTPSPVVLAHQPTLSETVPSHYRASESAGTSSSTAHFWTGLSDTVVQKFLDQVTMRYHITQTSSPTSAIIRPCQLLRFQILPFVSKWHRSAHHQW